MSSFDDYRSRKIKVYRNGDVFNPGKKLVVSPRIYRNFEQVRALFFPQPHTHLNRASARGSQSQHWFEKELPPQGPLEIKTGSFMITFPRFLHNISEDLNLLSGAVRKVYTLDGVPIHNLDDLQEGRSYVATSGELLKKVAYLKDEDLADRAERRFQKPRFDELRRKIETPIFGPASKAYRIIVHLNGDLKTTPLRLVLNYRTCKSLEQIITTVSSTWKRKILRLHDAETGRHIKSLHDLRDCMNVVAAGIEPLKRISYPTVNPAATDHFGEEDEKPHIVTLFPNGDAYHHGYRLTIRKSRYPTLRKLLETLNSTLTLAGGRATRIYSMDGQRVDSIDTLLQLCNDPPPPPPPPETGSGTAAAAAGAHSATSFVIVSGDDPFYKIRYDVNGFKSRGVVGLGGATTRNELMELIRRPRVAPLHAPAAAAPAAAPAPVAVAGGKGPRKSEIGKQVGRGDGGGSDGRTSEERAGVQTANAKPAVGGATLKPPVERPRPQKVEYVHTQTDAKVLSGKQQHHAENEIEEEVSAQQTTDDAHERFEEKRLQHFNQEADDVGDGGDDRGDPGSGSGARPAVVTFAPPPAPQRELSPRLTAPSRTVSPSPPPAGAVVEVDSSFNLATARSRGSGSRPMSKRRPGASESALAAAATAAAATAEGEDGDEHGDGDGGDSGAEAEGERADEIARGATRSGTAQAAEGEGDDGGDDGDDGDEDANAEPRGSAERAEETGSVAQGSEAGQSRLLSPAAATTAERTTRAGSKAKSERAAGSVPRTAPAVLSPSRGMSDGGGGSGGDDQREQWGEDGVPADDEDLDGGGNAEEEQREE
ncbi:hypothetical protein DFJ73DRAFT_792651 [Zopfochytrium polystomum]|nr:hypothetical protein DFJ73DRAFT_792651 [Zopfochytrium polystomum]